MTKAKVKEIFSSIQGEGPIVGYRQIFIRFCDCNLSCRYCDTDFSSKTGYKEYTATELNEYIRENYDLSKHHSISLTGGEPLLSVDFLEEFLPMLRGDIKIYLETNATLVKNFERIKGLVDIVGGDIKLKSSSGQDLLNLHKEFFEQAKGLDTFAKIVFDDSITVSEIEYITCMAKELDLPIVIQPRMVGDKMSIDSSSCLEILDRFSNEGVNVRLIPQVHKYLDVC